MLAEYSNLLECCTNYPCFAITQGIWFSVSGVGGQASFFIISTGDSNVHPSSITSGLADVTIDFQVGRLGKHLCFASGTSVSPSSGSSPHFVWEPHHLRLSIHAALEALTPRFHVEQVSRLQSAPTFSRPIRTHQGFSGDFLIHVEEGWRCWSPRGF